MNEIARRLALRPLFVDTRWESILRETAAGRYDCIIGGTTITPARERILAWSVPYMTTTLSLVVNRARTPAIRGLADLKTASVGVQAATTDYDAAVAMRKKARSADRALAAMRRDGITARLERKWGMRWRRAYDRTGTAVTRRSPPLVKHMASRVGGARGGGDGLRRTAIRFGYFLADAAPGADLRAAARPVPRPSPIFLANSERCSA